MSDSNDPRFDDGWPEGITLRSKTGYRNDVHFSRHGTEVYIATVMGGGSFANVVISKSDMKRLIEEMFPDLIAEILGLS